MAKPHISSIFAVPPFPFHDAPHNASSLWLQTFMGFWSESTGMRQWGHLPEERTSAECICKRPSQWGQIAAEVVTGATTVLPHANQGDDEHHSDDSQDGKKNPLRAKTREVDQEEEGVEGDQAKRHANDERVPGRRT